MSNPSGKGDPPPSYPGEGSEPPPPHQPPPSQQYPPPGQGYPPPQGHYPPPQHQQMAYHGQHQTVVMGQPATNTVIVTQGMAPRPANYLVLAIVTTICCNLLFGIIAIIFSVLSTSAADEGAIETARTRGKVSLAMSIVGILSTVIAIIAIIIHVVVFAAAVTKAAVDCSDGFC